MNTIAIRLIAKLVAFQLVMTLITELAVAAFAPRLLLLDDAVLTGSLPMAVGAGMLLLVSELITTLLVTRKLRPTLRALGVGSSAVEAADVLALYEVPWRVTVVNIAIAFVVCSGSLIPGIRPASNDLATQAELVLLTMTIGSVAALPAYVVLRATVTRVLEIVPTGVAREALAVLELRRARVSRVQVRLLFAVVAPVGFVALAASLLVLAHVRANETEARIVAATQLVRGALDRVEGSDTGRLEAVRAAKELGYDIALVPTTEVFTATRGEDGVVDLIVPLDDGHARVRFIASHLSLVSGAYGFVALVATVLAALLGARIGGAYAADLSLVTREVRAIGVADIIRGTRVQREATFASTATLMQAIDELGTIFREFASAQERAIDARAATERMRGLFLASMSHDLKAPLNAVLGFAELASRNPLSSAQRESLVIIEQRGRELLHLVQTILDAARVEAGELALAPEPTMVGDVVMAAIAEARELVTAEAGVSIVGEIQSGVPRLYVDPTRVTQALSAVILTAVRFAEQRVVRVRALLASGHLRIDVESPGRGVPDAELARIFEAFKDPERARRHGSLGLGLSLARSIVELHQGTIEASATAPQGTAFHVFLPAADYVTGQGPPSSR